MFRWFETRIDPFRRPPDGDPPSNVLGFYWYFIKQAPLLWVVTMLITGVTTVLEVVVFVYLGRAVDVISGRAPGSLASDAVNPLLYAIPAVLVLQLLGGWLQALIANQMIWGPYVNLIRWQSHQRVMRRPLKFFQNDSSGRVAYQVHEVGNVVVGSVFGAVYALWSVAVLIVSAAVVFAGLYWAFLIPLVLWVAGFVALIFLLVPRTRKAAAAQFEHRSRVSGRIVDAYTNVVAVKLFGVKDREDEYVRTGIRELLAAIAKMMRLNTLQAGSVNTLDTLLLGSVFIMALLAAINGLLPVGDIVVATALVLRVRSVSSMIVGGVTGLANSMGTVQNAMKSIAPTDPEPAPRPETGFAVEDGAIAFRDVSFSYPNGERVLDGLSFELGARSSLGVVGLSGAGKTTIFNLMAGLYPPDKGAISVDNRDLTEMAESELWDGLSVVTQEPMLFNRSVRENLLYGRAGASDAELEDALAKASAFEFVSKLVDNEGRKALDAHIGERGIKLSGGQRQRIAIARALLKDSPILVLDEPTSALDSETEAAIQETLAALRHRKTLLVIAHRVSTVAHLDRLIVLDKGKVVEEGTHEELVALGGIYSRFWRLQTEGTSAASENTNTPPADVA